MTFYKFRTLLGYQIKKTPYKNFRYFVKSKFSALERAICVIGVSVPLKLSKCLQFGMFWI
jgi:hypothetical protein